MGERVTVTITYLEQKEPPKGPRPPVPRPKTAILRAEAPPVHFYRYLYDLIGRPWNWVSRRTMDDEALEALIQDENVWLYILYVNGVPAGMAEFDARALDAKKEIELKFFGLSPDFTGKGMGRYFLHNVIDLAWSAEPQRLLLETCTLDHPAALPLYQRFGFQVFDRQQGTVPLIDPKT